MINNLQKKTLQGVFWSAIEKVSVQGTQLLLGIILARLLSPSDYGLFGMLAIFMALAQTFIDSGFTTALIQKKNRDELDFSTTFYFNIVVATFFYFILFLSAGYIAEFYKQPSLIPLIKVVGLSVIINSFAIVQRTKLTIKLDFKTQTKATLSSVIISGSIGILLAIKGFGVWALVWQVIIKSLIEVIILWIYSKWLPKKGFSKKHFDSLFSFGSKILASGLIDTIYKNIYLVIIGKLFSSDSLGYYTRAQQFSNFPAMTSTNILQRVTFPILSEMQDNNDRLINAFRKFIKLSALVIFPLMMGLSALADPLIRLTLTEKWIDTVWMLQLLTFAAMWYPINVLNLNVLNVKGRSDLFLRLEIVKKIVVTIILVISVPLGIKAIIWGQIFTSYFALFINTYYTKKIINYSFLQQMKDLFWILFLSFSMWLLILFSLTFTEDIFLKFLFGFIVGSVFYIGAVWIFNVGEIRLLYMQIKER